MPSTVRLVAWRLILATVNYMTTLFASPTDAMVSAWTARLVGAQVVVFLDKRMAM